ncbi:MAG TPA: signal peptidase II [Gammaproteobacteria bacterium]|nr:signal peptidase II [Gammaproteobacteria bacterium]
MSNGDAQPTTAAAEQARAGATRGAVQWLWLSFAVIALDQITKWLIERRLELFDQIELLPVLALKLLYNEGAAFSFLSTASGWQRWLFIALALSISIVIVFWLRRLPAKGQAWLAAALALVAGGALGNVIDRVAHGHVIDFILVHYGAWYFPAFNVADSAITVGAIMLIVDSIFISGKNRKAG